MPIVSEASESALRVLAGDECVDNAESLAIVVSQCRHRTITAADGERALELSAQFRPDVIFSDLGVPRLGGLELSRRLAGDNRPVMIAITGFAGPVHEQVAADAGFDLFFAKPADPRDLQILLEQASAIQRTNTRIEALTNQGDTLAEESGGLISAIRHLLASTKFA